MKKPKGIMPAFIHPPSGVPQLFMRSMLDSYRAGAFQHDYVSEIGSRPNQGRTENGINFLKSDAEYIFLVDTDMMWDPSDIIKLHQFAKSKSAKVVAGWALMVKNGIWPNAFRREGDNYLPWGTIEPFGPPIKVDAVGGSCLLVHRDVYEEVAEATDGSTAWLWQDDTYNPDAVVQTGEDIVFSHRVNTHTDYDIWYHPDAIFTHIKPTPYGPKEYLRFIQGLMERAKTGKE